MLRQSIATDQKVQTSYKLYFTKFLNTLMNTLDCWGFILGLLL